LSATQEKSLGAAPGGFGSASGFYRASSYDFSILGLFICTVVLSLTDLITTSIALHAGLEEGNVMLLGLTSFLRMNFYQTIAVTKLGFISGTALLAFLGMRSGSQATRRIVFSALTGFVILLLFVSVNNLVMINL
jgi:hypothetical protein